MKTSEQTDKIDAALAKAQAEMTNPVYDSTNPHFKSKYASLAGVRNAIIPVLAKHGVACVQELVHQDTKIGCATRLSHAGQWIEFEPFFVPTGKNDAQGFGSASTYARRYSLQAVAGVSGDEDDDANAVSAPGKSKTQKPITEPLSGPITPTSGSAENVLPDRMPVISKLVDAVNVFLETGDITDAVLTYENGDLSTEEKVHFWTFFDSTARAACKKEQRRLRAEAEERNQKEAA
jgi:hypothetical protein